MANGSFLKRFKAENIDLFREFEFSDIGIRENEPAVRFMTRLLTFYSAIWCNLFPYYSFHYAYKNIAKSVEKKILFTIEQFFR